MPPLVVGDHPRAPRAGRPGSPRRSRRSPRSVFNGRIEPKGDEDRFVVGVTPGQKLRIEVDAAELGSALDGVLQVRGPTARSWPRPTTPPSPTQSKAKAAAKKAAPINSPDPSLDFTVPAGMTEITLTLRDLRGEGGAGFPYRLTVEPVAAAAFQVAPIDDQVNIPRGGTAAVAVDGRPGRATTARSP